MHGSGVVIMGEALTGELENAEDCIRGCWRWCWCAMLVHQGKGSIQRAKVPECTLSLLSPPGSSSLIPFAPDPGLESLAPVADTQSSSTAGHRPG